MALIFLIVLVLILLGILNKFPGEQHSNVKGTLGERKVANTVERALYDSVNEYYTLNDVMFRTDFGTVQIDHIAIIPQGLLVIETKNYSGWIFGNEHSKYWTQVIYKDKHKFYSPIKQNNGHIAALRNVLGNLNKKYRYIRYQSLIVFNDNCTLKRIDTKTPVIYRSDLKYFISHFKTNFEPILNKKDMEQIYHFISEQNITDRAERAEHVMNIRRLKR